MKSVLEFDSYSENLTDLGVNADRMYAEADVEKDSKLYEKLNLGNLKFYSRLLENKEQITVRFSGYRDKRKRLKEVELFAIFGKVEVVYPVKKVTFSESDTAESLLDKEYKLYVSEVIEEENLVILTDNKEDSRKMAYELIREKLANNEEIYLRGNIIGLQRNGGSASSKMAVYVNIAGLGIIGIIPIKKWAVGYVSTEMFRRTVISNPNAIVNFRVCKETAIELSKGHRTAFICSRADYLKSIGYDPWRKVEQTLSIGSVVKVNIIEPGKTPSSYFGSIDGLPNVDALCFINSRSSLNISDIRSGCYYYGYVQKIDRTEQHLRVRLMNPADRGSNISTETEEKDTHDE